jgi:dihydrofolate reductase
VRRLLVFNQVSIDGYFVDLRGDMSWAHRETRDQEWDSFVEENASRGGVLVFGRVTYDLMASYWPTPMASQNDPVVARRMNEMPKIVFSRTLDKVRWENTRLVKGGLAEEIRRLKSESGDGMAIMGSGTIVAQLAPEGLIDEYQIVVIPTVLGGGRTMFNGVRNRLKLELTMTRAFRNGSVLLSYRPAAPPAG